MEPTIEQLNDLKADIESSLPDWLGSETLVFPEYDKGKKVIHTCVYFNFQHTGWVKIRANKTSDGAIDEWCNMRADFEFTPDLLENPEAIKNIMFDTVYADLADLFLCPTDGDSSDPLLHYGDRARFLPRDEARKMILTNVKFFAPRIAENSPFKEEDWYKEWKAQKDSNVR